MKNNILKKITVSNQSGLAKNEFKINELLKIISKLDLYLSKNKAYIDLSNCAGSLILGHNSNVFKKSLKLYLNKHQLLVYLLYQYKVRLILIVFHYWCCPI